MTPPDQGTIYFYKHVCTHYLLTVLLLLCLAQHFNKASFYCWFDSNTIDIVILEKKNCSRNKSPRIPSALNWATWEIFFLFAVSLKPVILQS